MPVHDWSRVGAGLFHDFHNAWIVELRNALNGGVLPEGYYALTEQYDGDVVPDVLALESEESNAGWHGDSDIAGATAVTVAPPQVRVTAVAEAQSYMAKQKTLAVHQVSGDRIVALIEIVSSGNKSSRHAIVDFLAKVTSALAAKQHLLIVDLHAPTAGDPQGIHGAIWSMIESDGFRAPKDKRLTLASYEAASAVTAYVNPIAVGDQLPDMPAFLRPGWHVNVPLEATYQAAWRGVPRRWREVLEVD